MHLPVDRKLNWKDVLDESNVALSTSLPSTTSLNAVADGFRGTRLYGHVFYHHTYDWRNHRSLIDCGIY